MTSIRRERPTSEPKYHIEQDNEQHPATADPAPPPFPTSGYATRHRQVLQFGNQHGLNPTRQPARMRCRYGRVLNPLLRINCESATERLSTLSCACESETPQNDSCSQIHGVFYSTVRVTATSTASVLALKRTHRCSGGPFRSVRMLAIPSCG